VKAEHASRVFLAGLAVLLTVWMVFTVARAQVLAPRPEELRFEAVLNEPIATADRHSVVAGTSALVVRDRVTGQCFVAVTVGPSVGLAAASCGE
jgi:hypothetical protein